MTIETASVRRQRITDEEDFFTFKFGKFAGQRIQSVPASYIVFLAETKTRTCHPKIREYYLSNLDVLSAEADEEKRRYAQRMNRNRFVEGDG